jgi:uncharacterized Ntn-hydrolase superfamily protein
MTFSIVARGADGTSWGVAVASKFLGAGALVPAAEAGAGAIATQSYANLAYRPEGLRLLRAGRSAQDVLDELTGGDPARATRQAGVVDREGGAATFTGEGCHPWAGGVTGEGYAIQGNVLSGEDVIAAMEAAWRDAPGDLALARRLLAALRAGDEAGGDRRGRQSAALLVVSEDGGYGGGSDVVVDLRVDDHPRPITELTRLLDLHDLHFGKPDPATLLPLEGAVANEVTRLLAALGYPAGDLGTALAEWAGMENFEERLEPGHIDPLVLAQLREAAEPPAEPEAQSASQLTAPSAPGPAASSGGPS